MPPRALAQDIRKVILDCDTVDSKELREKLKEERGKRKKKEKKRIKKEKCQRRNMGEVPGGRGTFWGAKGGRMADPKASLEVPREEEEGEASG